MARKSWRQFCVMSSAMKIYDLPLAPNPRRLRIFVAEKGLKIPFETVEAGRNRSPEFLAKNPAGSLPVLELDDGTCLAESVAICRYLEAQHPQPNLMGRDPTEQAVIEMWSRRIELNLFGPAGRAFWHTDPRFSGFPIKQFPDYGASQRDLVQLQLAWLDAQLKGKEFIAASRYTIADIHGLVAIDFAKRASIKLDPGLTEVGRWYTAMASRPSANA
ncbi:MAG: glutathione S-transferase family protein [Candidatus Binataceae bacterium]